MADYTKYILKVTAGPDYDEKNHTEVLVNTANSVGISTEHLDAKVWVRVKDYRGLPQGSPATSPYFEHSDHTGDRYSIAYSFRLKKDVAGDKLVFGNDFDHPIRDRLPWGFSTAFNWVKGWVDATMEGDPYADEPYLYSPILSSMNILQVGGKDQSIDEVAEGAGEKTGEGDQTAIIFKEGAQADGQEVREKSGMPTNNTQRKRHYQQLQPRQDFVFEKDRAYACDFFNGYLDFNEFSLKLPILTIPVIKYWDGQPLRYVLRNLETKEVYFVILFSLVPVEHVDTGSSSETEGSKQEEWEKVEKDKNSEPNGQAKPANDDLD
ncbi:hypothetical protein DBV05_g9040 [Lasiodiplodia theobromae]|uniref:Domain of unknown function at the cortex 1 domain-containing protein n=1 Tax=Lasiodiplodia theobromae TaxID=45133 RepID=A0A5N5D3Q3_9PEZI|nr:hypothetical protein DBV05_g9040 [Lasiodiplodia theobromae]